MYGGNVLISRVVKQILDFGGEVEMTTVSTKFGEKHNARPLYTFFFSTFSQTVNVVGAHTSKRKETFANSGVNDQYRPRTQHPMMVGWKMQDVVRQFLVL